MSNAMETSSQTKNEKCQLSLATLFGGLIGTEIRPQWAEG